ncbi:MAG: DNA helicase UvrD [Thermoproteota archaeon]|nr:MAG: DNA helicase UvrD [Candidatus Korarchaeota archaeon]
MKIYADFHIHSRYSRATSREMSIPNLAYWAEKKGLNLLGTGDFTHPIWLRELKALLKPSEFEGFYIYNRTFFVLTAEVNTVFERGGKVHKIHHLILAPNFEAVDSLNSILERRGDLISDGRPSLHMTPAELVDSVLEVGQDFEVIPAHIWTPWFSLFGSVSGFNSVEEAFEDASVHIHALETGLSSDPPMNWRLSCLDRYALVSSSDAHSPWSWRIGRELNVFSLGEPSFKALLRAIRNKSPSEFLFTIETNPAYGKYHYDGHSRCGISLHPREAMKLGNRCPVCGKRLTIGVLHRVEELADRPEGYRPQEALPYRDLLPLYEIISFSLGSGQKYSKSMLNVYNGLINRFGNELKILLESPIDEISACAGEDIANSILMIREGRVRIEPGYDGVYGRPIFSTKLRRRGRFDDLQDYLR